MFSIQQEKFQGPLSLLLDVIEREALSISEISLARVTEDYITYVRALGKIDPESLAEFLVVASQLMLIKSKTLLPSLVLSDEDEASIDELETRLAEYQRFRELARDLTRLEAEKQRIITREAYYNLSPIFYPSKKLTPGYLEDTFRAFLASLPKWEKLVQEKIRHIVSLEEKIKHIRAFLEGTISNAFSEIVKGSREKVDVIVSFLAILELARQKFVDLDQKTPFGDIIVKRL